MCVCVFLRALGRYRSIRVPGTSPKKNTNREGGSDGRSHFNFRHSRCIIKDWLYNGLFWPRGRGGEKRRRTGAIGVGGGQCNRT